MNNRETNYFRIGSFVIVGLALLIMALIIFGSGKLFQKTTYIETYFNESVQGLSVGSLVKYRGMEIGYVKEINFVSQIYGNGHSVGKANVASRYIYVKIAITTNIFTNSSEKSFKETLKNNR